MAICSFSVGSICCFHLFIFSNFFFSYKRSSFYCFSSVVCSFRKKDYKCKCMLILQCVMCGAPMLISISSASRTFYRYTPKSYYYSRKPSKDIEQKCADCLLHDTFFYLFMLFSCFDSVVPVKTQQTYSLALSLMNVRQDVIIKSRKKIDCAYVKVNPKRSDYFSARVLT